MTDDDVSISGEFISLGDIAKLVGVSKRTIQRLRKQGTLPADLFVTRLGRNLVRVDVARFKIWLRDVDVCIQDPAPRRSPEPPRSGDDGGPGMRLLP